MSLLKTIDPKEATGKVAQIYKTVEEGMGFVPNVFRFLTASPILFENQMMRNGYYGQQQSLSKELLAFIRLVVSYKAGGDYCVNLNTKMLKAWGIPESNIKEVLVSPEKAILGEKEKVLLQFVLRVVFEAESISSSEIQNLHKFGWNDVEIFDAAAMGTTQRGNVQLIKAFKVEKEG